MIGRVVVLPEYRHQGLGSRAVTECERWAREEGYARCVVESRDNKVEFYEKLGYALTGEDFIDGDTFRCIRMEKKL
jgi:GNAT superfamily N-acetyltransferase